MRPRLILLLGLGGLIALLGSARVREELLERAKDGSDTLMLLVLRTTSQFGSELTGERQAEQEAYRRIRLRDLR